jgi:membrane-bound lytic murein transglycosylase B
LAAIHLVETRMGRIRGDSTAGARGPMQFLPSTWAAYGNGGDIESNHDAIFTAARYLQANGAPADMAKAIWNYNHSDRYVQAVTRYAQRMLADPAAYAAYWHWDVYYRLASGDVLLPVGWTGR